MHRKQKTLLALWLGTIFLIPSAAYATETESVIHNQELVTSRFSTKVESTLNIKALELSTEEPELPLDISRSEPAYNPPTNGELLLEASLTQLGIHQDCTDLIQNSLAMIGLAVRRDQGGFDYGVQSTTRVGYIIDPSSALPGDIAFAGPMDGGHVWIVLDPTTSTGVHGGYEKSIVGGDGRTVIGVDPLHLTGHTVVRLY